LGKLKKRRDFVWDKWREEEEEERERRMGPATN